MVAARALSGWARGGRAGDAASCVVGGGLAGISRGPRPGRRRAPRSTLLERRPRLGGLTWSFRRGGSPSTTASTCSCAAAPRTAGFLDRIGVDRAGHAAGPRSTCRCSPPAGGRPGCAATGCRRRCTSARPARYRVPAPGRAGLGAVRAALALRRLDPDDPAARRATFGDWLAAHGQDPARDRRLWDLIAVADPEPAGRRGVPGARREGVPDRPARPSRGRRHRLVAGPAGELHADGDRGGAGRGRGDGAALRAGPRRWTELARSWRSVARRRADRGRRRSSSPCRRRRRSALLPGGGTHAPAGWAERLGTSPDRQRPRRATTGRSPSTPSSPPSAARCSASSTAPRPAGAGHRAVPGRVAVGGRRRHGRAGRRAGRPRSCRRWPRCCPAARGRPVLDSFVTRERHRHVPRRARAAPPCARRPDSASPGSYLAGAWTDTGWPATMEGAVRSGPRRRRRAPRRRSTAARRSPSRRWPDEPRTAPSPRPGRTDRSRRRCARPSGAPDRPSCGSPAEYHFGWIDAATAGRLRRAGGGKARAARAGPAVGAGRRRRRPRSGVPGAVAVELVHNFSLLHDDLMDGDRERRHRPHGLGGVRRPAGDPRRRRAADAGHRGAARRRRRRPAPPRPRLLAAPPAALIAGQAEDIAFERRDDVTRGRVPGDGRAARPAPCSPARAAIGAVLAGAPADTVAALDGVRRASSAWPSRPSTTCSASGATRRSPASRSGATCASEEDAAGRGRAGHRRPAAGRAAARCSPAGPRPTDGRPGRAARPPT